MLLRVDAQGASPAVTTGAASNVGDLSAVVSGIINPDGISGFTSVEFGTTIAYGRSTQAVPASISGFKDVPVTATLTALSPGSTYHYRVVCDLSGIGTRRGDDMTFTTGPASTPPSAAPVSATLYSTVALLTALVNSGSSDTTVAFEYGLTTDYGSTATANSSHVPMNLTGYTTFATAAGLQPATTYHVRCKVTNHEGSNYGPDATFTTLDAPVITTLLPANITDLSADVNGTIDQKGCAYMVNVEYGKTMAYGSLAGGAVGGTGLQPFTLHPAGLQPGTTYHYRLVAQDLFNTRYADTDRTFTTLAGTTPPTVGTPTTLVQGVFPNRVDVHVTSLSSGSSPATLSFEYGLTTAYGQVVTHSTTIPTNTRLNDLVGTPVPYVTIKGLASSTTYHFRAKVTNAQGTAWSDDATFTTPAAPTIITGTASAVTDLAATLNGTVDAGALTLYVSFEYGTAISYGHLVQLDAFSHGSGAVPVSTQLPGLLPGTTYHFRIKAVNSADADNIFYGDDHTFTTGPAKGPPVAGTINPYYVSAATASLACESAFSGSSPATVVIQYGTTKSYGQSSTLPETIPVNTTSGPVAVLTGLSPVTTYHVRYVLTNALGSSASPDMTFVTAAGPVVTTAVASAVSDLTSTLNGNAQAATGQISLYFEFGISTQYGSTRPALPGTADATAITQVTALADGLLPRTTYHFRLCAIDSDGSIFHGKDKTFTTGTPATAPLIEGNIIGSLAANSATVSINVKAGSSPASVVTEYGTTDAYGTQIHHSPAIPTSSTAAYLDVMNGLQPDTVYHYRITAANGQGSVSTVDATFATTALPKVTTSPATGIKPRSATLNGTFDTMGGQYTVEFDYGDTTAYGHTIAGSSGLVIIQFGGLILGGGGGSLPRNTAATVHGLHAAANCHFRLKLTDGGGNPYYGDDATFTTPVAIEFWRRQQFGDAATNSGEAADTANPSGDGIPNLMKYALWMNPGKPCVMPPVMIKSYNGEDYLCMRFPRNPDAIDVTYEVQAASHPAGPWTVVASIPPDGMPAGPGFVSENVMHGAPTQDDPAPLLQDDIEVRDLQKSASAARRFMRISVRR